MTEICKSISQVNREFMCSYFTHKEVPYSLREGLTLRLQKTCDLVGIYKRKLFYVPTVNKVLINK